jgi:ABC-type nickel/cobalt efflux system permease component RcnA
MAQILDQMITLDTDHYCNTHSDLQAAVKGMSPIDQKIWLLLHYVKHGRTEGRKYKLKNQPKAAASAPAASAPAVIVKTERKREHKTNKDVTDVHELIKKFQHQHHNKGVGVRDRKNDTHAHAPTPMKTKNVFWEITN